MDIALALGGGGYRGIAHIGVIDGLQKSGFHIRAIAGTSAGGLVGAAFAAGNTPLQILHAVQSIDQGKIFRRRAEDGPSLMGHAGLIDALGHLLSERTFADLAIPFACTAVDLNTCREIYLREGKLLDAVSATMAVPGILPPQQVGPALLVDGAVLDPVPVSLARALAPGLAVVAVPLSPAADLWNTIPPTDILSTTPLPIPVPAPILQNFARMRFGQALRIFTQSMEISSMMLTELRLNIDRPDVILRPDVHQVAMFDQVDPMILIDAGLREVESKLPQLRRETSWRGGIDRLFRRIQPVNEPKVLHQPEVQTTGAPEPADKP
jgi:NTE family protein